nr:hypothetical protein [Tanacetum cinerariifolium]
MSVPAGAEAGEPPIELDRSAVAEVAGAMLVATLPALLPGL